MDTKQCAHLKTSIEIDREFVKMKRKQNQIFECFGKKSKLQNQIKLQWSQQNNFMCLVLIKIH